MKKFLIPSLIFFVSILVNNGILIKIGSDENRATLGILLLIIAIGLIINPVKILYKKLIKWKVILIQIVCAILMVLTYLVVSAILISSRPDNFESSIDESKNTDAKFLTESRNELIASFNQNSTAFSHQTNDFYSIVASYNMNEFSITYSMKIPNNVALNEGPINALVPEVIKNFQRDGTIKVLKSLKFISLKLTYKASEKEVIRTINLEKL